MNPKPILAALAISLFVTPVKGKTPDFTIRVESPVPAPKGRHWLQVYAEDIPTKALGRRNRGGGLIEMAVDARPEWHAASGRLIRTGATFCSSEEFGRDVPGGDLGHSNNELQGITHSEELFLAPTRRGANNDEIPRDRAPLFMARVDPDTLRIRRGTKRVLLPKVSTEGLDLNPRRFEMFGLSDVAPEKTVAAEGLAGPPEEHDSIDIAPTRRSEPNAFGGDAKP
jgi:hypothetical protein